MAELKIKADSGGGTVSFKGPATTTSNAAVQLTLPVDDGTASQYLQTDGSGALSWATVSTAEQDASTGDYTLTSGNLVIATSGKGIDFTANTDDEGTGTSAVTAETLNDYERGTWTPAIKENAGASYTYQTQTGNYVKIGDLVWVGGYIRLSGSSGTTSAGVFIQGFPFSSDTAYNSITSGHFFYINDSHSAKVCRVNGSEMEVFKQHAYTAAQDNEMFDGGNERWAFAGWYTTA